MFNGSKELITINESIADIKASFPDYTRDVMRNWEQRHGFPKAIIKKSARADCNVEGYVLVQTCDCAKIILHERKNGKSLDEAFRLADELIIDSLSQISENSFPRSSELKLFKKVDFICYKEKLVSLTNQLESTIISHYEINKAESEKMKSDFLTECSNHIEEYFQTNNYEIMNSDKLTEIESLLSAVVFFNHWGLSREHNEIIEEANKKFIFVTDEYKNRKGPIRRGIIDYSRLRTGSKSHDN